MQATLPAALLAALALAGCASHATNTTLPPAAIGQVANVTYGTILAERQVAIEGHSDGVGAIAGAAVGGTAGSFIGGDVRSNILAAIGGAALGGLAGNAAQNALNGGAATEFIIREDDGQTISVVQSNEQHLRTGERVMIIRGAETRLMAAVQS